MSNFAWVTLATNDSYSLGALVLAHSLKRAGTAHQLAVLITPGVSNAMRERLQNVFNLVEEVNVLDSQDSANLALLARPELGVTFTKLHCWRLVQFDKCVFLDADTLVLQNCDELFEREELSAAPDVGWPDCFNSGVFVYRPNVDTYGKLLDFAVKQGSFDGGDQGLLNLFFSDWAHRDIAKHLPFIYNTCSTACYSYLPAFKQFGQNVKILHFIGAMKPWLQSFDSTSGRVNCPPGSDHVAQFLQLWWTIFFQNVHRDLTAEMNTPPMITHLLQSITICEELFVNNPASCNKHNEPPFRPVDPWDGYEASAATLEMRHTEATTTPYQGDEPPAVVQSPAPQSVLQRIVEFLTGGAIQGTKEPQTTPQESEPRPLDPPKPQAPHQPTESHCQQDSTRDSSKHSDSFCQTVLEDRQSQVTETKDQTPAEEAGIAGALAHITLGSGKTPEQEAYEHQMRRQFWEAGNIDYMGKDSFNNIWARISKTIDNAPAATPAPAAASSAAPEPTTAAAAAPAKTPTTTTPPKSSTGK